MEIWLKYFVFFSCTWKIKLLNTLKKTKSFFWQFQVIFHMYIDIRRKDDYDDEESSNKDTMSNMMMKNMC